MTTYQSKTAITITAKVDPTIMGTVSSSGSKAGVEFIVLTSKYLQKSRAVSYQGLDKVGKSYIFFLLFLTSTMQYKRDFETR